VVVGTEQGASFADEVLGCESGCRFVCPGRRSLVDPGRDEGIHPADVERCRGKAKVE
jgi:hypothetical protein